MKRILRVALICLVLLSLTVGCNKSGEPNIGLIKSYKGKEIASITYKSVKYNGGYTIETLVDFETNGVSERRYLPDEDGNIPKLEAKYRFKDDGEEDFFDYIYTVGLLSLKETYNTNQLIMDGSGWTFIVSYADGTEKVSKGDNCRPYELFDKADYAFYNLYGQSLFGTLPTSYTNPPSLDVAVNYTKDENTNVSDSVSGVSPSNYTWRSTVCEGVDNIAVAKSYFKLSEDYSYTFCLWTANMEYKFDNLTVKSYALDGSDEKTVLNTPWFKQKEFPLTIDRIYVITVNFDVGVCEYPISTAISSNQ